MAAFIFDASGIVKRYIQESGTAWIQGLADPAASNVLYSPEGAPHGKQGEPVL